MSEFKDALRLPGFTDAIDVSRVQSISDADAVYRAGFRAAWVKASEGVAYCDPRALAHLDELGHAGLLVSVYGFARISQGNPRAQAERLLACAGDVYRTRPMLDLESAEAGKSATELCDFAEAFVERINDEGASSPTLYTYTSFLRERLMPEIAKRPRLVALDLHIAQYRSLTTAWAPSTSADMPRGLGPWGDNWRAWQYSGDKGFRVPGVVGDCDRNLIRGDETEVRRWFGYPTDGQGETFGGVVHGTHVVDSVLAERES